MFVCFALSDKNNKQLIFIDLIKKSFYVVIRYFYLIYSLYERELTPKRLSKLVKNFLNEFISLICD